MANEKERREDEIEIKKAVKELSINEIDEIMFSSPDSATEADEEYEEESELSDSNSIFQSITPKPLMEEKYPSPTHAQQGKGKRKTISYGSSDNISRTEQAYRAFEMAKENRKIIEGVVISAQWLICQTDYRTYFLKLFLQNPFTTIFLFLFPAKI